MEIKIQNSVLVEKNISEKEIKKAKKDGKFVKCPPRRAPGSKNARWGRCE